MAEPRSQGNAKPVTTREDVLRAIKTMIARLTRPLPAEKYRNGWTERSRLIYESQFRELEQVMEGHIPPERADLAHLNIPKSTDHLGIVDGDLLEKAAWISN